MKALAFAALLLVAPMFVACSSSSNDNSAAQAEKQDEKVMEKLGDTGDAELAVPNSEGVTQNGDSVVAVVDATDIK